MADWALPPRASVASRPLPLVVDDVFKNHVFGNKFHFTTTGGTFSDWFYYNFIKPFCAAHDVEPLPYHLVLNAKDREQAIAWARHHGLTLALFSKASDLPLHVFYVDYTPMREPGSSSPKCMTRFVEALTPIGTDVAWAAYREHYENVFTTHNCSRFDMSLAFVRQTNLFLEYLTSSQADNNWNPTTPGPGPGFEFLYTPEVILPDDISDYTSREYIEGAHNGIWLAGYSGTIHTNPRSDDIEGFQSNPNVPKIGMIPPRSLELVTNVRSMDIQPPVHDSEAKEFFADYPTDEYHQAPVCLLNELNSMTKFCPGDLVHPKVAPHLEAVSFAFDACVADWGLKPRTVPKMTLSEVTRQRNWNTSPGYPYNRLGASTCREAFNTFASHVDEFLQRARVTWRPTIYNVFGKKEILKSTKGDDIRTIIGPDIAHQLMSQMLTLNIANHVGGNFRNSHTQVGRTRYHGDVNVTARKLAKFPVIEEYDISKWDRSIHAFLLKLFFYYVWLVLDSDDLGDFYQLSNMFESTIYSHLSTRNGELFRKRYGVPSGFTLTTYANSWIHTFLMYFSWHVLKDNKSSYGEELLAEARRDFDFVCYGDDGLMGMTRECASWFNHHKRGKLLLDIFNIQMPPEKCATQDGFSWACVGHDPTGIKFLGDVMADHDGVIQPVFSLIKCINSIIHHDPAKNYTQFERIVIAFTHYVELRFHPRRAVMYNWLQYLISKYYRAAQIDFSRARGDFEIVSYQSLALPDLIKVVSDYCTDATHEALDNFIYHSYYA